MQFVEEVKRENVLLRAFFMGPTGSGKSRAALELASKLFGGQLKTTLINTERGREKLYADRYSYSLIDLCEEEDFSPEAYMRALDIAEQHNPGGIYVVDSASHEWMGKGGILQMADRFGDWKTVRPKHNAWVERMLATQGHLIVCCRAKMKYEVGTEQVQGRERQVIRMLGVGPIQSDDLQYEFNTVVRFDQATHEATFSGHVDPLVDTVHDLHDATEVAETLTKWLSEGEPPKPPEEADAKAVAELTALLLDEGHAQDVIEQRFAVARSQNRGALHPDYVAENTKNAKQRLQRKRKAEQAQTEGNGSDRPASEGDAPAPADEPQTAPQTA